MCLAVPARVVELLADDQAVIDVGGVRNRISLALVDDVALGDYVIVHTGFAISRLDVAEAEKTLALFAEIAEAIGGSPDAVYPRVS
jgi:hydrogenase expression/formation protein HypC